MKLIEEMFRECSVHLGDEVKDPISGFTGTATAITFWIHNCARVNVQPKGLDKDGKLKACEAFDHLQLVVTKPINPPAPLKKTGGPCDDRSALRRR